MTKSTERLVDANGVRLAVTEAGDRGAPVVVLTHGFPELAYSWRHPVLGFTSRDRLGEVVTGFYREVLLDGAGHWVQQERPDEVNAALLEFLADVK